MPPEQQFQELKNRQAVIDDLNQANSVLGWDPQTGMPPSGAGNRGHQLATMQHIAHTKLVSDGRLLDDLRPYDVHWSRGSIGYFSSYALGNLISTQLWECIPPISPTLRGRPGGESSAPGSPGCVKKSIGTESNSCRTSSSSALPAQKSTLTLHALS